ncbi:hypothetical protein [Variovorax sp. GT1P44]|uniref:hypothetical protein n=1 Tax=Variovorax sp. GT1P44 TaxID=3443742 RepID=UPI003F488480
MNALRLLVILAVVGAAQSAIADPVNHCKGPDGRMTVTDRPCGDPATERSVQQQPRIVVEQIQAEDIFRARDMVRRDGSPYSSPELMKSAGASSDPGISEAGR